MLREQDGFGIGPRTTPVADGDKVFVQSAKGEFQCLNAATGKVVWRKNFVDDFGAIYIGVHEVEANLIIPVVMARAVKLHPAVIAVGVVVVGELFGIVGLVVAVPIIASIVILTEELWVKEVEAAYAQRTTPPLELPVTEEPLRERDREPEPEREAV